MRPCQSLHGTLAPSLSHPFRCSARNFVGDRATAVAQTQQCRGVDVHLTASTSYHFKHPSWIPLQHFKRLPHLSFLQKLPTNAPSSMCPDPNHTHLDQMALSMKHQLIHLERKFQVSNPHEYFSPPKHLKYKYMQVSTTPQDLQSSPNSLFHLPTGRLDSPRPPTSSTFTESPDPRQGLGRPQAAMSRASTNHPMS